MMPRSPRERPKSPDRLRRTTGEAASPTTNSARWSNRTRWGKSGDGRASTGDASTNETRTIRDACRKTAGPDGHNR